VTFLPQRYAAVWRADIRTTPNEVKVCVVKRAVPKSIQGREGKVPRESCLLVGKLNPADANFDTDLDALVEQAQQRATTLSLSQNTSNDYDIRLAMLMHKRWKWILGAGIVIGMALPNLPVVPII
jgi:hypothetical protein